MSVKSSTGSTCGADVHQGVVKCGVLKKVKTSKRKFFVLRAETPETSARLEYYDSERKFNGGHPPKRAITLKSCFNINRQPDSKHKHVIALYTKDDRFCIAFESDEDLEVWLKVLLSLQHGEEIGDGEAPKPTFEHVWQVTLAKRGLGASFSTDNCVYRLCLTDKVLSLIRKDCLEPQIELSLTSIRSCGNLKTYFYLEVGRSSSIGAGELWMETEDTNIAQNVHQTVYHAMTSNSSSREELGPKSRNRSSSATESSKPANMTSRRQAGPVAPKSLPFPQDVTAAVPVAGEASMPFAAAAATAHIPANEPMPGSILLLHTPHYLSQHQQQLPSRIGVVKPSERRHSVSGPLKKPRECFFTAGSVGWSGTTTVNHQRTRSLPLAQPTPFIDHPYHPPRAATNTTKRPNQSIKCLSSNNATRERCDSMPSRARTTSEGNHIPFLNQQRYLLPHRPMSIGSPITPPSAAGSTDSAGSSTSIDDDHWHDPDILGGGTTGGRCAHSLTPDEPIVEENGEDMVDGAQYLCHRDLSCVTFIPRHTHSTRSDDGYVDMSPSNRSHPPFMSPTASLSSVTSGTPSTDIRFVEYMLEKVPSYLTTSEDEGSDRPARAYSFGSRPETTKCRSNNHQSEAARERAYSFGAKTKRIQNRILPPYGFQQTHSNGAKSSSAPLLLNCRLQGSHSSLNSSNNYHVEMDFSKPQTGNYVDMGAGSKTPSGYVEMKPGIPPDAEKKRLLHKKMQESSNNSNNNNKNNHQDYVDMTAGTSPGKSECLNKIKEVTPTPSGYMDMNLGRNKKGKGVTNSPLSKSPLSPNSGDYMDMNCNNNNGKGSKVNNEVHYSSSPVKSSISPNIFEGSPSSIEYIDVDYPAVTTTTNDGYVEMTPGKAGISAHRRQTSLDGGTDVENSDYTNMSIGSNSRKRERKNSRKEQQKIRSQPIQIIQTTNPPSQNVQLAKGPGSSSSPSFCSWTGRKFSTGTPPKMCLPLSSSNYGLYSSLPRTRSRRNSRRDSKDSSTSSATTPSSSSTLFPMSLNSPSSPINSGKLPPTIGKYASNDDYAVMDFSRTNRSDSDYVNYNPAKPYKRTQSADYVPILAAGKLTKETANRSNEKLFRPITESNERLTTSAHGSHRSLENLRGVEVESPSRVVPTSSSRPGSTSSEVSTIVGSRPPSVGNDPTRPPSATSSGETQLCYASLELVKTEEDGSRSPRTLKSQSGDGGGGSGSSGVGTAVVPEGEGSFTYAKIDFVRSSAPQYLGNSSSNNAKVKH